MEEAMSEVKMVVEGVYSAKAALELSKKYEVEMPLVEGVVDVLFNGKPIGEAIKELMIRDGKPENNALDW